MSASPRKPQHQHSPEKIRCQQKGKLKSHDIDNSSQQTQLFIYYTIIIVILFVCSRNVDDKVEQPQGAFCNRNFGVQCAECALFDSYYCVRVYYVRASLLTLEHWTWTNRLPSAKHTTKFQFFFLRRLRRRVHCSLAIIAFFNNVARAHLPLQSVCMWDDNNETKASKIKWKTKERQRRRRRPRRRISFK